MKAVGAAGAAIGLDVGGTKIAAGLVAVPSGEVLLSRLAPTGAERGGTAVLETCVALAEELLRAAAKRRVQVHGIGVGVAELVDSEGNVTSGQTIAWCDLPVQSHLSRLAPTVVESDVRAAALAEALWGAGKGLDTFAYVTVGTGISSCLVLAGRPYAGARGNALILGSTPLSTICAQCGAELHPVLEEIASGPALVAHYNRQRPGAATRGEDVFAAAVAGDEVALHVLRVAGAALGNSVAFLVNVVDPEAVVVGGGLGLAGGAYWSSFVEATRSHIWADGSRSLPIVRGSLRTNAGMVGAAAALWTQKKEGSWQKTS